MRRRDRGTSTTGAGDCRTYAVAPFRRWFPWMVVGPIILFLVASGLAGEPGERLDLLIVAGFTFLVTLPVHFLIARTRLELGPSGVRLRQAGYVLAARWDEIEDLRLGRGREGFVTRKAIRGKGAERLARFRFVGRAYAAIYDSDQRRLLGEQRLIPIEAFAWHVRNGDMRAVILRFAPHLEPAFGAR